MISSSQSRRADSALARLGVAVDAIFVNEKSALVPSSRDKSGGLLESPPA